MKSYDYLIVGGGMTADAAMRGIRERDAKGTIGLVGAEPHAPYNRPPLSKGLWKGDPPEKIWRRSEETGATLHLGRRAAALDGARRVVRDDRGEEYGYGRLLLATGGKPRRLAGAPEGVIYFRTLDDYRTARRLADGGAEFVVVGGGFIGAEVAAALRMQDRAVTMIVREEGIGGRVFPADLARHLVEFYRRKGVVVHTGDTLEGVSGVEGKFTVRTRLAGTIPAGAVVAGLGIEPDVELARSAGLLVENGIVVDEGLRASGLPEIFAAGDVASFVNPALGRRVRVEHEDNANRMGKTAGRNMAGAGEAYHHLPFFYSDLFELGYEAVGDLDARHETVADWKREFEEGVVYYLEGGRVRGVLLWNVWGQVDAARALIAAPGPFTARELRGRLPAK